MGAIRFLLGDQLSRSISSLRDIHPLTDIVLMVEVQAENTYVRHHRQKIVLVLSAMRHFAQQLRAEGFQVDYIPLDDPENSGNFSGELQRALARHPVERIVVTESGEWRVWQEMQSWSKILGLPVEIRSDDRFLCPRAEFADWGRDRKNLRLEFFYRHMRRRTGWLMNGDQPMGGAWNYDQENRKSLPKQLTIPLPVAFPPDELTAGVIRLVNQRFSSHFGDLSTFGWAVTRQQAFEALNQFIAVRLPYFGAYQDAMKSGEDLLFHSALSPYLNLGLLDPREVCQAALDSLEKGAAPLASVEGFIRQILGWREFVRGIYWFYMPGYAATNYFQADRPLPDFYWTGDTPMNCLRQCITATRRNAYAHHIQRLMVTGNFALLAGISPPQVEEWYLIVYADAFEWVELPNTHGMALFADGGIMASKPYAASGAYIQRMSDYCRACAFDPNIKLGERACPFNYLYWNFLLVNEEKLKTNPRMAMPYRMLGRMNNNQRQHIQSHAQAFLDSLEYHPYHRLG